MRLGAAIVIFVAHDVMKLWSGDFYDFTVFDGFHPVNEPRLYMGRIAWAHVVHLE